MGTPRQTVGGTWFLSLLFYLALSAVAYAQSDTAWLFKHSGSEPLAFFADDTGNVYVVGWSEPNEDRVDVLLLKIDSLGHLLWARTYDHATATGATRDKSGNIYITGHTTRPDGFGTMKMDSSGKVMWTRVYPHSRNNGGGDGFLLLHEGSVYVASGMDTIKFVKHDSLGNQLWLSNYGDGDFMLGYGQGYDGP